MKNLWTDILQWCPEVPLTVEGYLILSALAILIGAYSLRGNPTKGWR